MDTLLKKAEFIIPPRAVEFGIITALVTMFLLSSSGILSAGRANDLIANSAFTTPILSKAVSKIAHQLNPQLLKEEFEKEMHIKYSGYSINNVVDGIKHIQMVRYFSGRPVRINVVEMNRQIAKDYEIKPATASTNSLAHKTTVRTIAGRTNSVVAINGSFFKPQTGVPLGTLMIDGKLFTGPIYNRAAIGIFDNDFEAGRVEFRGSINVNGQIIKIDNINQPRMLSSYVLVYTRDWGSYAPPSPRYGVQFQIENNRVIKASANSLYIPQNGYVIVGPKDKLKSLYGIENVEVKIGINPEWDNVKHIISGGPYLVRNSQIFVDTKEEKLSAISGKNPRSAIGYTSDGNFIIAAIDGREGSSVGLTLNELAYFMKSLGCVNAINLDGGGSTVMYVNGKIVNNPPQPGGIGLSNALVISRK